MAWARGAGVDLREGVAGRPAVLLTRLQTELLDAAGCRNRQMRRSDVGALAKRVQRLEQAIIARDATSSIPETLQPPRNSDSGVGSLFGLRGTGSGSGHMMDMGGSGH